MKKTLNIFFIIPPLMLVFIILAMGRISSSPDLNWREPPSINHTSSVEDEVVGFDKLYKDACDKIGLGRQCYKDLKAIAIKESGERPEAIGDRGTSYGMFQIHLPAHPDITIEQAQDPQFSVTWTAKRLAYYQYPEYRTQAIQCHNGCSKNNGYAESVKTIANGL